MHAAARVLWLALSATPAPIIGAPSELRPAIFAVPTAPEEASAPAGLAASAAATPTSLLSERVRTLVSNASEQLLAEVKAFAAPPAPGAQSPILDSSPSPSVRVVHMPHYIVKAARLRREPVAVDLPLLNFTTLERDDRRMKAGFTTNLLRMFDGSAEVNLNVLQVNGQGLDHPRDFARVEIEFKLRW
jgi:hypothetical protein